MDIALFSPSSLFSEGDSDEEHHVSTRNNSLSLFSFSLSFLSSYLLLQYSFTSCRWSCQQWCPRWDPCREEAPLSSNGNTFFLPIFNACFLITNIITNVFKVSIFFVPSSLGHHILTLIDAKGVYLFSWDWVWMVW